MLPNLISVFRRAGAKNLHVGSEGETMSWGNIDSALYLRRESVLSLIRGYREEAGGGDEYNRALDHITQAIENME